MSSPPITYDVSELVAWDFFGYDPSLVLAWLSLSLYVLAAFIFGLQTRRAANPNAQHMHLVTITGLTEAAGYAALIYLCIKSGETNIYGAYVSFQVFVVLSPNLLQAANYATVNKLIRSAGLSHESKLFRPGVVTWTFVAADIFALIIQSLGITLWATSKGSGEPDQDMISLGSWITVAGLAVQLFSFCIFILVVLWVQRHPKNTIKHTTNHTKIIIGLYATIALVSVRNIFRFVEFIQGAMLSWPYSEDTYVISEQEVLFYTLDTLPVFLCFVFYVVFNPAVYLPKEVLLTKDQGGQVPPGAIAFFDVEQPAPGDDIIDVVVGNGSDKSEINFK